MRIGLYKMQDFIFQRPMPLPLLVMMLIPQTITGWRNPPILRSSNNSSSSSSDMLTSRHGSLGFLRSALELIGREVLQVGILVVVIAGGARRCAAGPWVISTWVVHPCELALTAATCSAIRPAAPCQCHMGVGSKWLIYCIQLTFGASGCTPGPGVVTTLCCTCRGQYEQYEYKQKGSKQVRKKERQTTPMLLHWRGLRCCFIFELVYVYIWNPEICST